MDESGSLGVDVVAHLLALYPNTLYSRDSMLHFTR